MSHTGGLNNGNYKITVEANIERNGKENALSSTTSDMNTFEPCSVNEIVNDMKYDYMI